MKRAESLHEAVLAWYAGHARPLPWRDDPEPWRVLVSEFMLQQTPVARVHPVFERWLERWPTPAALAIEPLAEAIRAWGRLGYPRRAVRLHAAARSIVERHDGRVPSTYEELRELPGVGDYTAAAVASFAFGARRVVLDTNVRRVFARVEAGRETVESAPSKAERGLAEALVPDDDSLAPVWAAATMELGALVCSARSPRCEICPVADLCRWRACGRPADERRRSAQGYAGTDRQVRGRILAALRDSDSPVSRGQLDVLWPDAAQRERCLEGLIKDGLAVEQTDGISLPT